jgi:hypothetical protein
MQTKNLTVTEMAESGKGLALLADLTAVDSDGDSYEPGAFSWKGEQWSPLISAHDRRVMPFGKARVYEEGDKAFAELHMNLDTQAGRDWHSALKFDLAKGEPVQEWSYGYQAMDFQKVFRGASEGRVLKQVDVHEVSTVIRGAGRGTRTVDIKGLKAALKDGEFKAITEQLGTMADVLAADPGKLSATGLKQLDEIHANLGAVLMQAKADPEHSAGPNAALLEAEAKAMEEIERIYASMIAGDAIRAAQRHLA